MTDDNEELWEELDALPDDVRLKLSDAIRTEAERLSEAQKASLRSLQETSESGSLEASCTVVPGEHDLEFIVQAGGDLTTKPIRDGSGVDYDYGEAFEYGTAHQNAKPFFWPTYRAMRQEIEENIQKAIDEAFK